MLQVIIILGITVAQSWAGCPTMNYMESLDLEKFMGTWHQYGSFGTLFVHGLDRCISSNVSLSDDGMTVSIVNDRISNDMSNHIQSVWPLDVVDPAEGAGNLRFKLKLPEIGEISIPVMVLSTDYDRYAVLYSCRDIESFNFNAGWIFTRKQTLPEEEMKSVLESVDNVLEKHNLERSMFFITDQENCNEDSTVVDGNQLRSRFKKLKKVIKVATFLAKLVG